MARNRARRGLRLNFSTLACSCGDVRVYGVACGTCGVRPRTHEANIHVQRRRRLAAQIRAVDPDPTVLLFSLDDPSALRELLEGLDTWMPDFWEALQDLEEGLERALILTARLHEKKRSFDAVAQLRPWRGIYREVGIVMGCLVEVWNATLKAFEAPSLIEAQAAQRELQEFVDTADAAFDRWIAATDQLNFLITSSPEELMFACLASAITHDSPGREVVDRLLAQTSIVGPVAEMLAGYAQIAQIYSEQQAFLDTTKNLVTALRLHAPKAVAILEDQFYAEQLARSIEELHRSGSILRTVATVCGDEHMTADTALRYLHDIVESGTRHPLALVAALENGIGYRAALKSGAAQCIRTVRGAGHHGLADDLDLDVRNAVAHRSYRLTPGGGVDILNDSRNLKKHITSAELVDLLTGGGILSLCLIAGVVLFASESGLDIPRLLDATDTLPIERKLEVIAVANHWPRPHIVLSGDATEIHVYNAPPVEVAADVNDMLPLAAVLAMASQSPPTVQRLLIHDGQESPLTVNVALARDTMHGDGQYYQALKWLRFTHSLRRGDQPATPAHLWRALILARATQAVEPDGVTTIRNLVALRTIVRECDDEATAHTLTELINSYREQLHHISNSRLLTTNLPDMASTTRHHHYQ